MPDTQIKLIELTTQMAEELRNLSMIVLDLTERIVRLEERNDENQK